MNYEYNRIIDEQKSMTDHRKYSSPIPRPQSPTNGEYKSGKFFRYFVISEIDSRVIEIDEAQFATVPSADKGISPHLWKPIRMKWKLKGPRFDISNNGILQKKGVVSVNTTTVQNIAKRNPKIMAAIRDFTLFATLESEVREFVQANPGELVYKDNPNRDYEGLYHIHPTKGPMEGPQHTMESHALLEYKKDISTSKPQLESPVVPVANTPARNDTSSGGSSGGY